ncbi:hypothetical protein KM043_002273 [Ampulex compressa]|nr:hypothetical protein KM043_002273 [Ampulex compressa]
MWVGFRHFYRKTPMLNSAFLAASIDREEYREQSDEAQSVRGQEISTRPIVNTIMRQSKGTRLASLEIIADLYSTRDLCSKDQKSIDTTETFKQYHGKCAQRIKPV